jgi:hypothetical protein
MSPDEFCHRDPSEFGRSNLGAHRQPPFRFLFAVMKSNPAKLPGIAKDQRLAPLPKDQMIMFFRFKPGRLDPQIATHPKVDSKPVKGFLIPLSRLGMGVRKDKEQLFPTGDRAQEFLLNESARDD